LLLPSLLPLVLWLLFWLTPILTATRKNVESQLVGALKVGRRDGWAGRRCQCSVDCEGRLRGKKRRDNAVLAQRSGLKPSWGQMESQLHYLAGIDK